MYSATDFCQGVIFPALVSAVLMSAAMLMRGRRTGWASPLAVVSGFVIGYPLIANASPAMPPRAAGDWLFWLSMVAGVMGAVDAIARPPTWARTGGMLAMLVAMLLLILRPATLAGSIQNPLLLCAVLAVGLTAMWWFVDRAISQDATPVASIGVIGIFTGAALLILLSDSLRYAAHAGSAVAGAVGVMVVVAMWRGPRAQLIEGVTLPLIATAGVLLAISLEPVLVNVRPANAALVWLAAPILWASRWLPLGAHPWLMASARLTLTAAPVLVAVGLAAHKAYQDFHGTGGYDPWG